MPRRDPLAVLARLRDFERDQARLAHAGAEAACAAAAQQVARTEAALGREAVAPPADYAAWMPAALAARSHAARGLRKAEGALETTRAKLAMAGAEAEALAMLLRARQARARHARLSAEQAMLEDAARARYGRDLPEQP